jgi:tellurite resistance protein TerC
MALAYYLHYGLSAILVFVGVKMLASEFYKVPIGVALGVIVGVLAVSLIASWIHLRRQQALEAATGIAAAQSVPPSDREES